MKVSNVIYASPSLRRKLRPAVWTLVAALSMLPLLPVEVGADEQPVALERDHRAEVTSSFEGVAQWMKSRFTDSEIESLSREDFGMEAHHCSCADEPEPHFPYRVVLFTTPKGDLVARAEAHEQTARFTPLAVRKGDQYCTLESEEHCYGSFASVCEFTDFRYGPTLEPYFPTCK